MRRYHAQPLNCVESVLLGAMLEQAQSLFLSSKAQAKTASELSKSMESMRGHLQAQLRCKEAENSRLCMQIKVLAGSQVGQEETVTLRFLMTT